MAVALKFKGKDVYPLKWMLSIEIKQIQIISLSRCTFVRNLYGVSMNFLLKRNILWLISSRGIGLIQKLVGPPPSEKEKKYIFYLFFLNFIFLWILGPSNSHIPQNSKNKIKKIDYIKAYLVPLQGLWLSRHGTSFQLSKEAIRGCCYLNKFFEWSLW